MKKASLLLVFLGMLVSPQLAYAQYDKGFTSISKQKDYRLWAFSTNIPTWAFLGTAHFEAERAISQKTSLTAGVKFNPWTFKYGQSDEFRARAFRPYIGMRRWLSRYYTGWYIGLDAQYSIHSYANMHNKKCFEGWYAGLGFQIGYAIMLNERLSLALGAGLTTGCYVHRIYDGPRCDRLINPHDAGIAIQPSSITAQLSWLL